MGRIQSRQRRHDRHTATSRTERPAPTSAHFARRADNKFALDADDSFRRESTRFGWTLGIGIETELTPRWAIRLDGAYFEFGEQSYRVNRSLNNSCGPNGPRAPCSYTIRNRTTALRLAIVYRFGH